MSMYRTALVVLLALTTFAHILGYIPILAVAVPAAAETVQPKPPAPQPSASAQAPSASGTGAHELSRADLEAFLDGFVPFALEKADIAGLTLAVVKDGQILFEKGYGYADVTTKRAMDPDRTLVRPGSTSKLFTWTAVMQLVEQGKLDLDRDINDYLDFKVNSSFSKPITMRKMCIRDSSDMAKRTPVTPDSTLFRPGSISKLFTWTSVMQLVEQGKLDLSRDVNDYLDFKIPPAFGKPITLRNIMTHTSGFEEAGKDLFVKDAQHMDSLEYYVKNHIPERIFPPGTVPAYSNYATALAGYIVQRVSGKPFEQYVAENIFTPLEMKRSTFVQPLPEDLKPMMSNGYDLSLIHIYRLSLASACGWNE